MLAFTPDPDAFGIVTAVAERRCAARPDPFIATFVALFLFFEPLLQRVHDFIP